MSSIVLVVDGKVGLYCIRELACMLYLNKIVLHIHIPTMRATQTYQAKEPATTGAAMHERRLVGDGGGCWCTYVPRYICHHDDGGRGGGGDARCSADGGLDYTQG